MDISVTVTNETISSYMEATLTAPGYNEQEKRNAILNLLQHQLSNCIYQNPQNSLQLIKILGGIENILKDYVSASHTNDLFLTELQIHEIHELLHNSSLTRIQSNGSDNDNTANADPVCYEFSENDTYLHSIFGEQNAIRILQVIHTKIAQVIISLTAICWVFFKISNTLIYPIYVIVLSCVLWIPFFIIYFLAGNIKALKLLFNSFEFWFKMFYAVFLALLSSIHVYHYGLTHKWQHHDRILHQIASIFAIFLAPMLVLNVSCFDAHNISKGRKIFFSTTGALVFTFQAIQYSFLLSDDDDLIVYISPNNSLSFASIISGAARILAIFMWRQAILIIIRDKKQKCVLIKYIPSFKWITNRARVEKHVQMDKNTNTNNGVPVNHVRDSKDSICEQSVVVPVIINVLQKKRVTQETEFSGSSTDHSETDNCYHPVLDNQLSTPL